MTCASAKNVNRIDLEWAKQKIVGFAEMLETVQRVKQSEANYKKITEHKNA